MCRDAANGAASVNLEDDERQHVFVLQGVPGQSTPHTAVRAAHSTPNPAQETPQSDTPGSTQDHVADPQSPECAQHAQHTQRDEAHQERSALPDLAAMAPQAPVASKPASQSARAVRLTCVDGAGMHASTGVVNSREGNRRVRTVHCDQLPHANEQTHPVTARALVDEGAAPARPARVERNPNAETGAAAAWGEADRCGVGRAEERSTQHAGASGVAASMHVNGDLGAGAETMARAAADAAGAPLCTVCMLRVQGPVKPYCKLCHSARIRIGRGGVKALRTAYKMLGQQVDAEDAIHCALDALEGEGPSGRRGAMARSGEQSALTLQRSHSKCATSPGPFAAPKRNGCDTREVTPARAAPATADHGSSSKTLCSICQARPRKVNFSYCTDCTRDRAAIGGHGAAKCMRAAYAQLGSAADSAALIACAKRIQIAGEPHAPLAAAAGAAGADDMNNAAAEDYAVTPCRVCGVRDRLPSSRCCAVCADMLTQLSGRKGAMQTLRAAHESLGPHAAQRDVLALAQQLLQWSHTSPNAGGGGSSGELSSSQLDSGESDSEEGAGARSGKGVDAAAGGAQRRPREYGRVRAQRANADGEIMCNVCLRAPATESSRFLYCTPCNRFRTKFKGPGMMQNLREAYAEAGPGATVAEVCLLVAAAGHVDPALLCLGCGHPDLVRSGRYCQTCSARGVGERDEGADREGLRPEVARGAEGGERTVDRGGGESVKRARGASSDIAGDVFSGSAATACAGGAGCVGAAGGCERGTAVPAQGCGDADGAVEDRTEDGAGALESAQAAPTASGGENLVGRGGAAQGGGGQCSESTAAAAAAEPTPIRAVPPVPASFAPSTYAPPVATPAPTEPVPHTEGGAMAAGCGEAAAAKAAAEVVQPQRPGSEIPVFVGACAPGGRGGAGASGRAGACSAETLRASVDAGPRGGNAAHSGMRRKRSLPTADASIGAPKQLPLPPRSGEVGSQGTAASSPVKARPDARAAQAAGGGETDTAAAVAAPARVARKPEGPQHAQDGDTSGGAPTVGADAGVQGEPAQAAAAVAVPPLQQAPVAAGLAGLGADGSSGIGKAGEADAGGPSRLKVLQTLRRLLKTEDGTDGGGAGGVSAVVGKAHAGVGDLVAAQPAAGTDARRAVPERALPVDGGAASAGGGAVAGSKRRRVLSKKAMAAHFGT